MNKEEFCTAIENECLNTDNISFSITTAKGLITLFWSVTFRDKTNAQAYDEYYNEIEWANMKLDYLENKYKSIHIFLSIFHTHYISKKQKLLLLFFYKWFDKRCNFSYLLTY